MIQQIFTDMDGTLLDSTEQVPVITQKIIQRLSVPVTLVSARSPLEMLPTINQLNLIGPQIAFNGGLIFDANEITHFTVQHFLLPTVLNRVAKLILDQFKNVDLSYFSATQWYTLKPSLTWRSLISTAGTPITLNKQFNWSDYAESIYKITLITASQTETDQLIASLKQQHFININIEQSSPQIIDITNQFATKANGIKEICNRLNVSPKQTIAFGNGQNDISMFETVGLAIAMANAPSDVQKAATYVTNSNDANGVGVGIKKYVMREDL